VADETTELYLIRHGESVPNVTPIIGGMRGDAGLTGRGREQAQLLEKRLREEELHADQLYASTLPRALETAEYVARALDLRVQPDDELHELRPGEADGLTVNQWRERYWPRPPAVRDAFTPLAPGGESWVAFLARAGAAIAALVDRHPGQTVVAVCHGGVIEASFYLAFGLGGSADRVSFAVLNTSITRWRHRRGPDGRREWTAVTLNDAGHLSGADTSTESPHQAVPTPPDEAEAAEHKDPSRPTPGDRNDSRTGQAHRGAAISCLPSGSSSATGTASRPTARRCTIGVR
jgi:probable phosphoglycerate mutase